MLLFHRRTKKAIKYVWGFISILIVLSMVVTYSGFTMLARTTATPPVAQPTPEPIDTVPATQDANPSTASNTLKLAPATPDTAPVPVAPKAEPVPQLNFSL